MFTLQDLIDKEVNNRKERKITSWQASKLGSCLTGVYLERLGKKPDMEFDNRTLRVFSAGNIFEEWVTMLIHKNKDMTVELQARCVLPEYDATGYADIVISGKENFVYEIKSKHSFGFKYLQQEGANRQHKMQLWFYLKCLKISKGRIFYVSKDDLRVLDYEVELNDKLIEIEVLNELSLLNNAWQKKLPPPLPSMKDWREKYCRWHKQCISQLNYLPDVSY